MLCFHKSIIPLDTTLQQHSPFIDYMVLRHEKSPPELPHKVGKTGGQVPSEGSVLRVINDDVWFTVIMCLLQQFFSFKHSTYAFMSPYIFILRWDSIGTGLNSIISHHCIYDTAQTLRNFHEMEPLYLSKVSPLCFPGSYCHQLYVHV